MLEVLADRTYRHLFLAQVVALLGTGLATVALGLLAYDLAGDNAAMVLGTVFTIKMVAYCRVALKSETRRVRLHFLPLIVRFDCHRAYASCTPLRDVINRSEQTLLLLEGAQ
ncbi:hypothetical protein ROA7023_03761 [Roseisalinus antarcticus]|uniref:Uncharacterized protein n=1 Tax=Roseisalinus antarcticus TaxID=254357 RepID=A0A1Y5TWK0_9RHOB|nr:hypothetical protein ROA7023_03761 [Roseisalinus antarcticus]